ncbi:MAG: hypothetical protein ACRD4G_00410 [Bryobacteraceae bacterium]
MNVFIGGSRAVSNLNATIRARLDDLMKRGCTIFIGDANGADKAVQGYLAKQQYPKVVVFCMEECRNNVGNWPTRQIAPPHERRGGFSYYSAKDIVMSREAQCGVMLWDAKSKGTLQNMLNLVEAGKRTLVYFVPTKDFHVLANRDDLQTLFTRCDRRYLDSAARRLGLKSPLMQHHLQAPSQ